MDQTPNRARQFVADVKAGLSDEVLRRKYQLPDHKFYVYKASALDIIARERAKKAPVSRRIDGKQLLADIRLGMDDESLMARYELTQRQLQSAFRLLINSGLATAMELSNRLSITKSQVREAFVEMGKAIRELD